jgi:hypothetical protein
MVGPIEFYDNQAKLIETVDVWWMINHYESYCRSRASRSTRSCILNLECRTPSFVIPRKREPSPAPREEQRWVPAFAGMTKWVD